MMDALRSNAFIVYHTCSRGFQEPKRNGHTHCNNRFYN